MGWGKADVFFHGSIESMMDYFVYIRQQQDFIADECVDYLYQKSGLKIEFDPEFEVSDQTGFLPISLSMDDGQSPISSGFELSISDIRFTDDPDLIDDSIWLYEQDFRNAYGLNCDSSAE